MTEDGATLGQNERKELEPVLLSTDTSYTEGNLNSSSERLLL
jgi:hypothetical protein